MWLQGAFKSMKAFVAMEIHWQHNGNTVCRKDNCKTHTKRNMMAIIFANYIPLASW